MRRTTPNIVIHSGPPSLPLVDSFDDVEASLRSERLPLDVVILGAGMVGATLATQLAGAGLTVLVLEAGPLLLTDHYQDLAGHGWDSLNPARILDWICNVPAAPHVRAVGGLSTTWGGWLNGLTRDDLKTWPPDVAAYLQTHAPEVARELGVETRYVEGQLQDLLLSRLETVALRDPITAVRRAPLAVQARPPVSGMIPRGKFSSVASLLKARRQDIESAAVNHRHLRRLFLVTEAPTVNVIVSQSGVATAVQIVHGGRVRELPVAPSTRVVLAMGTIPATALALRCLAPAGQPWRAGRNLMVHTRSNFMIRIPLSRFPSIGHFSEGLEMSAALIEGAIQDRRFQIQLVASVGHYPEEHFNRSLLDGAELERIRAASRSGGHLLVVARTVGEMRGRSDLPVDNPAASSISLHRKRMVTVGPCEVPAANVRLVCQREDEALWSAMDATAIKLLCALADDPRAVEFHYDGSWHTDPPSHSNQYRDSLGSTFHESGTLFMGMKPENSVTDSHGRFWHLSNVYALGQALFPTVGGAGPVLSALTHARMVGQHFAAMSRKGDGR